MTPQDVITAVREQIQDIGGVRYDDPFMLRLVNQVVKRIAILRPDLFDEIDTMTCVVGALQTAPVDSVRIVEVLLSGDNATVKEVNRETLDLMTSTWQAGATGMARDWMRHVRSPNRFFVFPPSPAGQTLTIEYSKVPADCAALTDVIPNLNDVYKPCVVDGVIWLAESIDDEHVNSGRAKLFMDSFHQLLGFSAQNKAVTDVESSNMPPSQVI